MTDHMHTHIWEYIENVPDGCIDIEVLWHNNVMSTMCSCDIHWNIYLGKDIPDYFRIKN